MADVVLETQLITGTTTRRPDRRGKVRDIYDCVRSLLVVATDRISAFDVVLPTGIPGKGKVLTALSLFWFDYLREVVANHFIDTSQRVFIQDWEANQRQLAGRFMWVRKVKVIPVECVVRGYLSGSGWKEYQKSQSVCGVPLPIGLRESDKLPHPIFTPTTKADSGHDEPMTMNQVIDLVGRTTAEFISDASLRLYKAAAARALENGIIIADTKFEFGYDGLGSIILIDEVLTPDSSRFWDLTSYEPGRSQDSFDKQYVRDYLESINWNKQPPAPALPTDVVANTTKKYLEGYRRIVGRDLEI